MPARFPEIMPEKILPSDIRVEICALMRLFSTLLLIGTTLILGVISCDFWTNQKLAF